VLLVGIGMFANCEKWQRLAENRSEWPELLSAGRGTQLTLARDPGNSLEHTKTRAHVSRINPWLAKAWVLKKEPT